MMSTPDSDIEPTDELDPEDLDTVAGGKGAPVEDGGYLKKNQPNEF